jgi:hypothetical protein
MTVFCLKIAAKVRSLTNYCGGLPDAMKKEIFIQRNGLNHSLASINRKCLRRVSVWLYGTSTS